MKTLIVDDNVSDQLIAQAFLEKEGIVVVCVTNGFDALDLLTEEGASFSLLVVDLQMPQISGLELIKRIRRIANFKTTPILVMSARHEVKDVKLAIEYGANDYAVKPLDGLLFAQKVRKLARNIDTNLIEYTFDKESEESHCKIEYASKIVSISEIGLVIETSIPLEMDDTTALHSSILAEVGFVESPLLKVTKIKALGQNMYRIHLGFVGLTEKYARLIRTFCRKRWALEKENKELEDVKTA